MCKEEEQEIGSEYHLPVLYHECIEALAIQANGVYVDATLGGAGHTRGILQALGSEGRVYGFDQDPDIEEQLPDDARLKWLPYNFRYLQKMLRLEGIKQVDGILADLGVSSHQFDTAERGFSFRFQAQLDMRMNPASELSAKTIVASYTQDELQELFSKYGELRNAKTLAQCLVQARQTRSIETIADFLDITASCVRGQKQKYYAQVFQALRIEVNDEMAALKEFLQQASALLKPGGRLVIISYHSLEDRLVKYWFKNACFAAEPQRDTFGNALGQTMAILNKKPILPSQEEMKQNSRARSAKLRIAQALEKA